MAQNRGILFVEKKHGGEKKGLETVLKSEIAYRNPEASLKFFLTFWYFFALKLRNSITISLSRNSEKY